MPVQRGRGRLDRSLLVDGDQSGPARARQRAMGNLSSLEQRIETGERVLDSHPALPADRVRYEELRAAIGDRLRLKPELSATMRARFFKSIATNDILVQWSEPLPLAFASSLTLTLLLVEPAAKSVIAQLETAWGGRRKLVLGNFKRISRRLLPNPPIFAHVTAR
jgi:hypothetical protein